MNSFKPLTSERLILRHPAPTDWEMISFLRSDPEVNKFVKRPAAETQEKAMAFISNITHNNLLYWVICLENDNKMIGSICLWNISKDQKKAEVGYDLAPSFHGKGIMNEALKLILQFGFNTMHFEKIEAYTQHMNAKSIALLERNGFNHNPNLSDPDIPNNVIFELYRSK